MRSLAELMPWGVSVASAEMLPAADPPPLHPKEAAISHGWSDSRRREFAHGRACAHAALRALESAAQPILAGDHGQPLWPLGFVGSITHAGKLCAAVAARDSDYSGLGIDCEVIQPLSPATLHEIATPRERAKYAGWAVPWGLLLFSAKESAYKCAFPALGRIIEFAELEIDLSPGGTFRARFPRLDVDDLDGRYRVDGGHVTTLAFRSSNCDAGSA